MRREGEFVAMFKEADQYTCLFNTRKTINGHMEFKYSSFGWGSPCILCSLFPYEYMFPDPNSPVGTLPISNCVQCPFVFAIEGKAIYHAGDTCLNSEIKLVGELYKPEIALLPSKFFKH